MGGAAETIRGDLAGVKNALGVAKLRVMFQSGPDGTRVSLEVQEVEDSEWVNWDEGFALVDDLGMLQEFHEQLSDLAPYLDWNGITIIV